ncbi:hypothetical protein [Ralstonia pseudosolanacearum]
MKERTIKEIEEDMDKYSEAGELGKVLDLVDEHGNTYDKMYWAIIDGDISRVIALEKLGIDVTTTQFVEEAIKQDQEVIVFHQVKQGANLDEVIELAKKHENDFIVQWAQYTKRNKMGEKK